MLNEGQWQGRQIVPAGWVQASMQRHTEQTKSNWSRNGAYGYSYQWWYGRFEQPRGNFTSVTGVGYGSQRLFVIPEKKLSITSLAGNYAAGHWSVSSPGMPEVVRASP